MIRSLIEHQTEILKALGETGILIGVSTMAAILIGLPLGTLIFVTRKNGIHENSLINKLANLYVNVVRSFPFLIFVVAIRPITRFLMGRFLGTVPATLPLSLVAIALYARYVEQALLDIPHETIDTAQSLGATPLQTITKFLYLESRSSLILGLTSSTISVISYSTIMGVVGGGGIGDFALRYGYHSFNYPLMYSIVLIMIIIVQLFQYLGARLASKLDKR